MNKSKFKVWDNKENKWIKKFLVTPDGSIVLGEQTIAKDIGRFELIMVRSEEMNKIEEILHAIKTIGDATYEQQQKIHEGKLVRQERYKINLAGSLNELDIFKISNFCKAFNFCCHITSVGEGVYNHFQIQFAKKESKPIKNTL